MPHRAIMAAYGPFRGVITVGQNAGPGLVGFSGDALAGLFGNLVIGVLPVNLGAIKRFYSSGAADLLIESSINTLPKSAFYGAWVIPSAGGATRFYATSAATYGGGIWSWGTGSSPVYQAAQVGNSYNLWLAMQ